MKVLLRNLWPVSNDERPIRAPSGRLLGGALLAAAAVTGCSFNAAYNAAYTSAARRPASETADGKALLKTTPEADAQVFTGNPTSFTGAATTLTMPLGQIARETAKSAFADAFMGGAELSTEIRDPTAYAVIVAPRVVSFSYEYNQLKNVGFAITPTVTATVEVKVLDEQGKPRWEKTYLSGAVEGPSYMINTAPGEEINKLAHKALYDLFAISAKEIITSPDLLRRSAPAGSAPPVTPAPPAPTLAPAR